MVVVVVVEVTTMILMEVMMIRIVKPHTPCYRLFAAPEQRGRCHHCGEGHEECI